MVVEDVKNADEDFEQVEWDELILFGEDRDQHRDDLGQEGDILRLKEIEVA